MSDAWVVGISAVASLGGVVVGDVLGGRRARQQWQREQGEQQRRELLDVYERILSSLSLTELALSLQRLARDGDVPTYPGAPGLEAPQDFALLVNRAALLGAPDDAVTVMRGMLKAMATAIRLTVADDADDKAIAEVTADIDTMQHGLLGMLHAHVTRPEPLRASRR